MREVGLTLSNYLKEKNEKMVEREFVEVLRKLTEMTISKLKRGEKGFCLSLTMSPLVYRKLLDERNDILNYEHINPEKIDFKNPKPQCFRLKHNFRLF